MEVYKIKIHRNYTVDAKKKVWSILHDNEGKWN